MRVEGGFEGLKARLRQNAMAEALALCKRGDYASAVAIFDEWKGVTELSLEDRHTACNAYYSLSKQRYCEGDAKEAIRLLDFVVETSSGDDLAKERRALLRKGWNAYRTYDEIKAFRMAMGVGCTDGRLTGHPAPFLDVMSKTHMPDDKRPMPKSDTVEAFYAVGPYWVNYQGYHRLSKKIREYKAGSKDLARPLACLLADYLRVNTRVLCNVDLVVPCPGNPFKFRERGLVPSISLARELASCLCLPFRDILALTPLEEGLRLRDLAIDEAIELVYFRKGFATGMLRDRTILLVDDVLTTGRTMTVMAMILRNKGCKAVYGAALARTGKASA